MKKTTTPLQLSPDGKRLLNITPGTFQTLAIPEGVEVIEPITSDYLQIEVLKIPSTVREMNTYWTGRVYHRFEVAKGNPCYTAADGVLYSHDLTTLISIPLLLAREYQIPPTVTRIATYGLPFGDFQMHIPAQIRTLERSSICPSDNTALIWCDIPHPEQVQIDPEAFEGPTDGIALIVPPEAVSRYREHPVFAGFNVVGSFDELVEQQQHLLQLSADDTRIERVLVDEDDEEVEVLFLPANVTEVNAEALYQERLRAILVHPDNRSFRSVAGALCNYELTEVIRVPARCYDFEECWPATVTRIHSHAFCNNRRYDIGIPPQVTHIGEYAFAWNDMEEFDIPENVVEIAETAFNQCSELSKITVDRRNPHYSSSRGILYDKPRHRIIIIPPAYTEEQEFKLLKSVTSIGSWCYELTSDDGSLHIPEQIRQIESHAFDTCYGVRMVVVRHADPCRIEVANDAFNVWCYNPETDQEHYQFTQAWLYVPAEAIERYRQHPVWGKFQEIKSLEAFDRGEHPAAPRAQEADDDDAQATAAADAAPASTPEPQPTTEELQEMTTACQSAQRCIQELRPLVEGYMRQHRGISDTLDVARSDLHYAHLLLTYLYDDRIQNEWSHGWIARQTALFESLQQSRAEIMAEHDLPNAKAANNYLVKPHRLQYIADHPDDFVQDKALLYLLTFLLRLCRFSKEYGRPVPNE